MARRSPSERKFMIVNQTAVKRFQMVLYLAPIKSEKGQTITETICLNEIGSIYLRTRCLIIIPEIKDTLGLMGILFY